MESTSADVLEALIGGVGAGGETEVPVAKKKSHFMCQSCGHRYAKWVGRCTACNDWGTIEEEVIVLETESGDGVAADGPV